MNSENLLWGLKDGILVHISTVKNGLECECFCPNSECGGKLVAKNNPENIKVSHFAHYKDSECNSSIESAIHLLAKKILLREKKMLLPDFIAKKSNITKDDFKIHGQEINFDSIIVEKNINGTSFKSENFYIRPDIKATFGNNELYVEFANTSFVKKDKLEKIKSLNLFCVEIDLSKVQQNEKSILSIINSNVSEKYWLNNPDLENRAEIYFKNIEIKKKIQDKIDADKREIIFNEEQKFYTYLKKGFKIHDYDLNLNYTDDCRLGLYNLENQKNRVKIEDNKYSKVNIGDCRFCIHKVEFTTKNSKDVVVCSLKY